MAYPSSLDELTDGVPSDGAAPTTALDNATYPHDDHHRALGVAVEAIEAELGTDPSGSEATVKARIAATETVANAAAAKASNLSDLASASSARTNLGLGGAATLAVGTTAGTVAAGNDSRFGSGVMVAPHEATIGPYSWPGAVVSDVTGSTFSLTLDRVYYQPLRVDKAITVTALGFNIGGGGAGSAGTKAIMGIYATTAAMQPTGAALFSTGEMAVDSIGNKEGTGSTVLQPGVYLCAFQSSATITLSSQKAMVPGTQSWSKSFGTPVMMGYVARTYDGTNPASPPAWTTRFSNYLSFGMIWTVN